MSPFCPLLVGDFLILTLVLFSFAYLLNIPWFLLLVIIYLMKSWAKNGFEPSFFCWLFSFAITISPLRCCGGDGDFLILLKLILNFAFFNLSGPDVSWGCCSSVGGLRDFNLPPFRISRFLARGGLVLGFISKLGGDCDFWILFWFSNIFFWNSLMLLFSCNFYDDLLALGFKFTKFALKIRRLLFWILNLLEPKLCGPCNFLYYCFGSGDIWGEWSSSSTTSSSMLSFLIILDP